MLDLVLTQALNGLASASSLFLVACGLSIIFGVTRIVNFAHGSLYMLGGYLAFTLVSWLGPADPLGFWGGVILAVLLTGLAGVLIEVLILRRIYQAPELFQLLATFGLKGEVVGLDSSLPPVSLLVNSSSLGMTGQPPLDLDLSPLPDDAIVYDLVYAPLQTELLGAAEARGLDTVDGLDMLIGQAALAFELFFGSAPPEGRDEELRALLTA